MSNSFFQFKKFIIHQDRCAMKVTTDSCLFGAWASEKIKSSSSESLRVLDIGTGTGLLSFMVSQQTNAKIDAIEIDRETFEQAKENIQTSPFFENIDIIHADARFFVSPEKYDCIISNPPFYENELKSGSAKKNKAHHNEGLILEELFSIINEHLQQEGTFYLLLPFKRNSELKNLFAKNNLAISHQTLVRQSVNHPYFRIMLAGKNKTVGNEIFNSNELSIKNEFNEYTPEFINLLQDYYLHL